MAKSGLTKEQVIEWALRNGFVQDQYGNLKKFVDVEGGVKQYRLKLQATSVRYEVQQKGVYENEWVRIRSGYLCHLSLSENDKLVGLK